ncbi:Ca2+-dependent phosphoinositide-specific phospholipase C [Catenovulum sediminis]|uniref:Ca2+-dependent phosphoinositide-specific phospholipase C n=1 Tax=Catenovulum sediminis TaxID=1740262 RepID=A0ABV1RIG7_9ALTE
MKTLLMAALLLLLNTTAQANLRYNEVTQKSSHNSYSRDEGILDQLVFHRIRSIEFDLFRGKIGRAGISRDWYVYHTPVFDTGTNCDKFSNCLRELQIFDQQIPQHEVVTVWFDIKDGFSSGQTAQDLDNLIKSYINPNDILKPSDLYNACPNANNLKQAVTGSCNWPTLSSLKGKWMFVITDPSYADGRSNRLGFTSASVDSNSDVDSSSKIFFNTDNTSQSLGRHIHINNFVSRRYVVNNSSGFINAKNAWVHHIATDKVNYVQDTWAKTHNSYGYPFTCINQNCSSNQESDSIIGIKVNSEDIWGSQDHFSFQYQNKGTANGRWQTAINVPSSHVDKFAKGCVMARAALSDDSPYFAVCRLADNNKLAVQYRDYYGNNSGSKNVTISDASGIAQEDLTYVKMDVYDNGQCVLGQGSRDGISWTTIMSRCFSYSLKYQGLAASSHGNNKVKFLFSNLRYWNNTLSSGQFTLENIGTVRSASGFQGSF